MAPISDQVVKLVVAERSKYVPKRFRSFPDGKQRYLEELEKVSSSLPLSKFIRLHMGYTISADASSSGSPSDGYSVESTASVMLRLIATPDTVPEDLGAAIRYSKDGKLVFLCQGESPDGEGAPVKVQDRKKFEFEYASHKIKVLMGEAAFFPPQMPRMPSSPRNVGRDLKASTTAAGALESRTTATASKDLTITRWNRAHKVYVKRIPHVSIEENINQFIKSLNPSQPDPPETKKCFYPPTRRCRPCAPLGPLQQSRCDDAAGPWIAQAKEVGDRNVYPIPRFTSEEAKKVQWPRPGPKWFQSVWEYDEFPLFPREGGGWADFRKTVVAAGDV
ncbi:hypothetical protein RUND412_011044 [Rhizina undulata]